MKTFIVAIGSVLAIASASAARFETLEAPSALDRFHRPALEVCATLTPNSFDCLAPAYRIVSRHREETVLNTVKQIIYSTGSEFVEHVEAQMLRAPDRASQILEAAHEVVTAAGFNYVDPTPALRNAIADLNDVLANEADNSRYSFVAGTVTGAYDYRHQFLAIVDRISGEVVIFNAGYSE